MLLIFSFCDSTEVLEPFSIEHLGRRPYVPNFNTIRSRVWVKLLLNWIKTYFRFKLQPYILINGQQDRKRPQLYWNSSPISPMCDSKPYSRAILSAKDVVVAPFDM